jgi:hypothetical protein
MITYVLNKGKNKHKSSGTFCVQHQIQSKQKRKVNYEWLMCDIGATVVGLLQLLCRRLKEMTRHDNFRQWSHFPRCSRWKITYLLNLLTYLLTPWSRVLLEKLTGSQLVKKFPAFYGTRRLITAFTSAHHLSICLLLCTYLLTPWSRVLLEKLTGLQLVKKFPAFYGTRRFITALTNARSVAPAAWCFP